MKILIACEESQRVCIAFREKGGVMKPKQEQIKEMAKCMGEKNFLCADDCENCIQIPCKCKLIKQSKLLYKAGYRKASDVLEIADDLLHDLAMEYAERGHKDYFAVCENVHLKVILKLIAEMRQEVEK